MKMRIMLLMVSAAALLTSPGCCVVRGARNVLFGRGAQCGAPCSAINGPVRPLLGGPAVAAPAAPYIQQPIAVAPYAAAPCVAPAPMCGTCGPAIGEPTCGYETSVGYGSYFDGGATPGIVNDPYAYSGAAGGFITNPPPLVPGMTINNEVVHSVLPNGTNVGSGVQPGVSAAPTVPYGSRKPGVGQVNEEGLRILSVDPPKPNAAPEA
ncbi:MAG: hypothetical protein AAFP90_03180 [Planctomycetota bacterium]